MQTITPTDIVIGVDTHKHIHAAVALNGLGARLGTTSIPVIIVTIVDQPAMGAAIGADEYLVKPVDKATLLAAVARCLSGREVSSPARPILVVEDDRPTLEVIAELLKTKGYAVATAADGASARRQVAASLPGPILICFATKFLPVDLNFQLTR